MECDVYLSGMGAMSYNKPQVFALRNVELQYQGYEPAPYKQLWNDKFVPNLSIIDLIFNEGPNASAILERSDKSVSQTAKAETQSQ